ncbi:DUF3152 domain-containing protein [Tsukamurella soli]|uniref:DUF3152 domain-containing protein n=1 Tax=Tsukamurella soli TaxID=644556 RepID=A0ABP8KGQ5_9ACTN
MGRMLTLYGWRAYAIPVLAVLTVLLIASSAGCNPFARTASTDVATSGADFGSRVPNPAAGTAPVGAPTGRISGPIPAAYELPAGGRYTPKGLNTWHVVPGTVAKFGKGTQQTFTYKIAVEDGMNMAALGGDQAFAAMVDNTLQNPQSWIHDTQIAFRRVDKGDSDFTISLTSPLTTRDACGYTIAAETSCYNPELSRVVLNEARWVRGAVAFQGDIRAYRQYQINHEVGHAIGYPDHVACPANGALAPIMMQQSFGVGNRDIFALDKSTQYNNNNVCKPNSWPYPGAS